MGSHTPSSWMPSSRYSRTESYRTKLGLSDYQRSSYSSPSSSSLSRELRTDVSTRYSADRGSRSIQEITTRKKYSGLHSSDSYVPIDKKSRYDYSPQFTVTMRPRVVEEGTNARFTCTVTGVPNPTATWYRGPVELPNSGRFISLNSYGLLSLEITGVSRDDAGLYTCNAINEHGVATCSASLEIQETEYDIGDLNYSKPRFEQPVTPDLANAKEGDSITLKARVTGKPLPSFKWLKDGVEIIESLRFRLSSDESGVASLCITHVQIGDTGLYHCVASNKFGRCETYSSVRVATDLDKYKANLASSAKAEKDESTLKSDEKELTLVSKMAFADDGNSPWFLKQLPDSATLQEGDPLCLECIVLGDPTPVVTWKKGGRTLKYGKRHRVIVDGNKHTLEISDTLLTDHGEYTATAESALGSQMSKTTYVNITPRFTQFEKTIIKTHEISTKPESEQGAPMFVAELPKKIEIAEDDFLRLNCSINGAKVAGGAEAEDRTPEKQERQEKEQEKTVVLETRTYTRKQEQTVTESTTDTTTENGLGAPIFVRSLKSDVVAEVGSSAEFKCSFGDNGEVEEKKPTEPLFAPMFIKSLGTIIAQPGDSVVINCKAVDAL